MLFTIKMLCDNSAFEEQGTGPEIARILRKLANTLAIDYHMPLWHSLAIEQREMDPMTLQDFISRHKITMTVKHADRNPNMADDEWMASAHHYKCFLRCGGRRMVVPFSQGSAITKQPTTADVLDCLASDASGVENAGSFEGWCAEYGYDTDSRKAEKTFKICKRQADSLSRLLGHDQTAYETLLWNTERL